MTETEVVKIITDQLLSEPKMGRSITEDKGAVRTGCEFIREYQSPETTKTRRSKNLRRQQTEIKSETISFGGETRVEKGTVYGNKVTTMANVVNQALN